MTQLKANCPSCAGPIEFKAGSTIVVVCPFCRSAVARTDRKLEDLGKVAEIVQSQSPLQLGIRGEFNGNKFELTGRAQVRHEQGGVWDEWYATFSNGWVGWLAEAQGKFYMTFYKPLPENVSLPGFDELQIGQAVNEIPSETPLLVAEKGTAAYIAADGEIPYKLEPNEKNDYADLTGKGGVFATIDYGMSPPFVFYGQEVSLADIGLADKRAAEREAATVASEAMGCPNCGGTLELRAPDITERVVCPYCSSLLDVKQGNLKYLRSLKSSKAPHEFVLKIGSKCSFKSFADGIEMEVIGAMVRSVVIDGVKYFWHEYLLYQPKIGFKWLVHSDNHWNFVDSINMADVELSDSIGGTRTAKYDGRKYKIFQDAPAAVEYVQGEFYWRVEVGERVSAADYVSPPFMLSQEKTAKEATWSLGTYLPVKEVEKAFGISGLPKPWNVAPNQPFTGGSLIKYGFLLLGILLIVSIFTLPFTGFGTTELKQDILFPPLTSPSAARVMESQEFELKANRNVRITAAAPVDNSWAEYNIDLLNTANNDIESVLIPVEYYHGVTGGESWSEGGVSSSATFSAVPAGKYKLRIEAVWMKSTSSLPVRVKVEQSVTRGVNFWLAFILLAIVPVITVFRKFSFESKRWSESMFGGTS
ncbi:MAG: DUF4178 domain-containing protein [Acidobacteria bacterium]|nr:DUF4178 domain-containing protein [Acidobacteriota bacterium]